MASELRSLFGIPSNQPVPLARLAEHLNVEIVSADELVPRKALEELTEIQSDAFSGGTFQLPSGRRFVVFNPVHDKGRIESSKAHELAHLLLDHTSRSLERVGPLTFLTCDTEQEEEADWLGGCLLLPRDVLLDAARQGRTYQQLAEQYQTSEAMARFRLNASGVLIQVGRARARRNTS